MMVLFIPQNEIPSNFSSPFLPVASIPLIFFGHQIAYSYYVLTWALLPKCSSGSAKTVYVSQDKGELKYS